MRLLECNSTGGFRLTRNFHDDKVPPYAILSHTWGDKEVLFKDLEDGTAKNKTGYAKIQFCGDQAERDGLKFFWVDTCCIDKSDDAELQNALDSMFRWYHNAAKCYVYLTDVSPCQQDANDNPGWEVAFRKSRWFTRGWTLQELIAPEVVEFFSEDRKHLGNKKSLAQHIHNTTGIPLGALQGNPLSDFSFELRMSWIENRSTTREEDRAYCLFGIFDVQMPLRYGEGEERAFGRLREEIGKHDRCLSNLQSTDPRLDKKRIEEAKGGLLADAYLWVLDSHDFQQWHDRPESRLLWIKGDPGKGKTMLLCGIVNELEVAITADGHCRNLAYFFCQATDLRINSAIAVLRGLICLLAHQQPRLISHVREYTDAGKSLSDANAWVALSDILGGMLGDPNLKPTCLVVDALDECVVDLPKLLDFVVRISSDRVKWLLTSRNEMNIERKLRPDDKRTRLSLELKANAVQVSRAVEMYIDDKLSDLEPLRDETILEDGTLLKDRVRDVLRNKANGTFLWVALVIQELSNDEVESWHVLQIVKKLPPGLNGMYDHMLNKIKEHSLDSEFCERILSLATVAYRPLHLAEIGGLSGLPEQITKSRKNVQKIVAKCGSFLTVRDDQIYLVHQSAKDYLSNQASTLLFPGGAAMVHHDISNRSLRLLSDKLRRDIYGLCAPGFPIDQVRVPDPDPLATVRYSCVYWIDHLYDWQSSDNIKHPDVFQDGGIIDDFLRKHYLYWLEALSLCKSVSQGILSITKLESILQVYASALVFSPARSMTREIFKQEERRWITAGPVVENDWNACTQTLEGHSDWVNSVAFSPDSTLVASGSSDKTVKIWDAATGTCTQTLEGHSYYVNSVVFSPDSKLVASGSCDKTIKIWNTVTGTCTQTLEGHSNFVNSVAFLPDSKLVASGSSDKTVKIWDAATGTCIQTLEGHSSWVNSVAFSSDSKLLASGSRDKTVKIWDVATGTCTQTLEGYSSWVSSVAFSSDSKLVASGSSDKTVKIWDTATGTSTQTLKGHSNSVYSVTFSPDSKLVASGSYDCTIKIWDVATGTCTQTLEGHSNYVYSVAFSPDLKLVASGSYDRTIKIWDAATGTYTQTLEGHSSSVYSVTFSPDLKLVVSGSSDRTVKIWDAATGACTQTLEGHSRAVCLVAFSPNSKLVASGSDDNTIKIWDAATGTCTQTLEGHSNSVYSVAFSPDLKLMASRSYDRTIKIWDVATGTCTQTLKGHSNYVYSVAFSPDLKLVASGSYDHTIKIWDTATGTYTQTLKGHSSSVYSVTFSPDLKLMVSGSSDRTVKIWDAATGACTQTLEGHSRAVCLVAFSPNSKLVASGSDDNTIKIWDAATGTCTQTLEGHSNSVYSVAFSPDLKLVASRSYDHTIKIWDAATGICTQTLKNVSFLSLITSWSGDAKKHTQQYYGVSSDNKWITRSSENWLWLPPGSRPGHSAVVASTIAIGCNSGRVLIMTFPADN
ncbi:WD40-repeat-containing domain protein [Lasiosphaeria hispida]|uniref:WD40-repeat-containing domain protein n=1 Tax=Lasiosphaeria hispida TaxID=260671 RepID=A0AAJ0MD59_9PEZI|nr:WD40-repeat-containing domain protein [Lasiosphaeria hispida]